jgi:hypothetical protein
MRQTVYIKDADGKIVFEGFVTKWTLSSKRSTDTWASLGIPVEEVVGPIVQTMEISAIKTLPESDGTSSLAKKLARCDHFWTAYVGLSETYDYCLKCNEKKT